MSDGSYPTLKDVVDTLIGICPLSLEDYLKILKMKEQLNAT